MAQVSIHPPTHTHTRASKSKLKTCSLPPFNTLAPSQSLHSLLIFHTPLSFSLSLSSSGPAHVWVLAAYLGCGVREQLYVAVEVAVGRGGAGALGRVGALVPPVRALRRRRGEGGGRRWLTLNQSRQETVARQVEVDVGRRLWAVSGCGAIGASCSPRCKVAAPGSAPLLAAHQGQLLTYTTPRRAYTAQRRRNPGISPHRTAAVPTRAPAPAPATPRSHLVPALEQLRVLTEAVVEVGGAALGHAQDVEVGRAAELAVLGHPGEWRRRRIVWGFGEFVGWA